MAAESSTTICNQAIARIGGIRINDYDDATDTKLEAIYCRLFFPQTSRSLMKDHYWPFAKARVQLSANTVDPVFQYDYQYYLPTDFLRLILFYNGSDKPDGRTYYTYELEGAHLLTNESAVYLRYVKHVTDVGSWDTLFIECIVLRLAAKLCMALKQSLDIKADIDRELMVLMHKVRAMDRMEEQVIGREALRTWQSARYSDTA
jgi:hypothetical protein